MSTKLESNYLKLRLNDQNILISLEEIHLVLPIAELHSIPNKDSAFAGILNYHGQALPVYHLSELIEVSKPQYDLNTPLLIGSVSTGFLGLLVSEVIEVINISEEEIQISNKASPYVLGIIENETWSAWILDLKNLLEFNSSKFEGIHE